MPTRRSFRFARNVGWNLLGYAGISVANFFCVPYLIRRIGVETYGLYILLYAAASYLSLLSFGASAAVLKYVAQFVAARNRSGLRSVLAYGLFVSLAGALIGTIVLGVGARFFVTRLFHVWGSLSEMGTFVLRCGAIAAVFVALTQFASAVMQGLQRFSWQNAVSVLQNGLMPVGAAAIVWLGMGLPWVAGWYLALNAAMSVVSLIIIWTLLQSRSTPEMKDGPRLPAKAFAAYSLSQWAGSLAWVVTFQFDKIFLVRGTSLAELTLYSVPAGLLQRLQVVYAMISVVLMPMMSELGPDARAELVRMYLKSVRFLLWIVLPGLVLLFALMPQFLSLWLGGDFGGRSVWPARFLVAAQLFLAICTIPHAVACSRDKPWYMSAVNWAQAVLSVVAWKLLVPRLGLLGVALGSLLAQALPGCVYLVAIHQRLLRLPARRYFSESLYAPMLSAGLLLAFVFPLHTLAVNWIRLLGLCLLGAAVFYGSTWYLLVSEDRQVLSEFLRWQPRSGVSA